MKELKKSVDKYISALSELNEEIQVIEDKKQLNIIFDEVNVCINQIHNLLANYRVKEVLKN